MKNKIFFTIFIILWLIIIILNFINKKETFSEQENKVLASFPKFSFKELIQGNYQKDLDEYINEHFIFRNNWLKVNSTAQTVLGKTENNGVYIGKDGYLFEKIEYNEKNIDNVNMITDKVEAFAKENNNNNNNSNNNIPTYFCIIPNSIYINKDKLPKYAKVDNQKTIILDVYSKMNDTKTINVVDILNRNKKDYIYFKTDHHMTSNGAYLVYLEICKNMKIEPVIDYEKEIIANDFLGTFDSKAQIVNQQKDYIEIYKSKNNENIEEVIYDNETTKALYNKEYLDKKDKYSYFLNGNNARVVVKTNNKNNKKLLIIKDSYSHIMAQFLCQNFEEIHFIDLRYYKKSMSEYAKENGITTNLIMYNFSNIISDINLRVLE